jgi:hypothetical protein
LSWGGTRYRPYAFTEHGAIMAASVLNSPRAIEMSIFVVRAFVGLRHTTLANREIVKKLTELEQRVDHHEGDIGETVSAIRRLMTPRTVRRRRIGFEYPGSTPGTSKAYLRTPSIGGAG